MSIAQAEMLVREGLLQHSALSLSSSDVRAHVVRLRRRPAAAAPPPFAPRPPPPPRPRSAWCLAPVQGRNTPPPESREHLWPAGAL